MSSFFKRSSNVHDTKRPTFQIEDLDKEINTIKNRIESDTKTITSLLDTKKYLIEKYGIKSQKISFTKSNNPSDSKNEKIDLIYKILGSYAPLSGASISKKTGIPTGSIPYYMREGKRKDLWTQNINDKTWSLLSKNSHAQETLIN